MGRMKKQKFQIPKVKHQVYLDNTIIYLDNGSTIIDTDKLLDDPYEYQSKEVRAECDIIHIKEMLAYYEKMGNNSKDQKMYQQPENPLEETKSKS